MTQAKDQQILELQKAINQLQQAVETLVKRQALLERKTNVTANTARNTAVKVAQMGRTLTLTESKVTTVENILRRY